METAKRCRTPAQAAVAKTELGKRKTHLGCDFYGVYSSKKSRCSWRQERALTAGTEGIITGVITAVSSRSRRACQIDGSQSDPGEQNTATRPQGDKAAGWGEKS